MEITVQAFNELLNSKYIIVENFRSHSKASEHYVDVRIDQIDGFSWRGSIPYYYRRTGLFIETPDELVEYLNSIYTFFTAEAIGKFQAIEKQRWETEMAGKETTKAFFDVLLNLQWSSVQFDLPANRNFARRIQDIKEFGYTIATDTRRQVRGKNQTDTHLMLVPIPKGGVTGYETMSPTFKAKAIEALGCINIYELSTANKNALLPDHKFPEIRWDEVTRAENPESMTEKEIREKFQLVDNQRNQQKREVCRKCFQTGIRGKLFGINYYYTGSEMWPSDVPKVGKDAERGCLGCGWYDIAKWRNSLDAIISSKEIKAETHTASPIFATFGSKSN